MQGIELNDSERKGEIHMPKMEFTFYYISLFPPFITGGGFTAGNKEMNEIVKEKIPQWYNDECKYDVVLSDDLDGLVSTSLLRQCKGWEVQYYYDFEHLYITDEVMQKPLKQRQSDRVWVDISILCDEKCFDNHVNRRNENDWLNPYAINPNIIKHCTNENYTQKYAGSTALMLWSLYDYPLPETEEGKMLLMCIDSTYKGYYLDGPRGEFGITDFRSSNHTCLKSMFRFHELWELQKRHTFKDFDEIQEKYKIGRKIKMIDGHLETELDTEKISKTLGLNLYLPTQSFNEEVRLETTRGLYGSRFIADLPHNYLTAAYTYKNKISASYIVEK